MNISLWSKLLRLLAAAMLPVAAAAAAPEPSAASAPAIGWGLAMLLALGGGVLLNLMPCVFPVLSIKAMGMVAGAGADRRRDGLAYAAGVMLSVAALATLLLALRAGGQAAGWGFQLQSPAVVALLALVFFALALSLSGLWQFGSRWTGIGQQLTGRAGLKASFFTGLLAVVVASPCTAPLMGAAVGAAVLMPWPLALGVFMALGLGLAAPLLLLSFWPGLAGRVPRPGPWMETTRKLLAFPLYLTTVWLLWVLGRQIGADGLAAVLAGLVVFAFVLWLGSQHNRSETMASIRHVFMALGLIAVLATFGVGLGGSPGAGQTDWWTDYSPARLAELRADPERAVLVNIGASWCVTCLVNERIALHTEPARRAFESANVVYMRGDWTRRDAVISDYLEQFNRNSVPFYALYPHDGGAPRILPQVLRPAALIGAVESLRADRDCAVHAGTAGLCSRQQVRQGASP